MLFGANPLPMPGAALKYLREKLQPWLDAQANSWSHDRRPIATGEIWTCWPKC